jgi:hypothetical protein
MAFSILTTIAFGLFLLVVLGKYYFNKDAKILGLDFGKGGLQHLCLIAGLVLLIIAVWVYPPVIEHAHHVAS